VTIEEGKNENGMKSEDKEKLLSEKMLRRSRSKDFEIECKLTFSTFLVA